MELTTESSDHAFEFFDSEVIECHGTKFYNCTFADCSFSGLRGMFYQCTFQYESPIAFPDGSHVDSCCFIPGKACTHLRFDDLAYLEMAMLFAAASLDGLDQFSVTIDITGAKYEEIEAGLDLMTTLALRSQRDLVRSDASDGGSINFQFIKDKTE